MSWTESDHARLVALKHQRAAMRRGPDEEIDKDKLKKLTIEIKAIKKRLIAHEKGVSVAQNAPVEEVEAPVEEVEAPVEEVEAPVEAPDGVPAEVIEAHKAWKDKEIKWTEFLKVCGGPAKAKEYRAIIEN